jgi:CBS domain-containing membrane protein
MACLSQPESMPDITDNAALPAQRTVWSRYYNMYIVAPPGPGAKDRLISVAGAVLGIVATGLLCGIFAGTGAAHPLLVAPMGASTVLLFALPASPLAQPWSVLGGNTLSAIVGISVALAVPNGTLAAGLAVGGAIAVMSLARCLHPPGGAVALSAVLGGASNTAHPLMFALYPVGLNSLLLILAGMAFHRMSGHAYPHKPVPVPNVHETADGAPLNRSGVKPADLEAALQNFGETLDVSQDDLQEVFKSAEVMAAQRQFGQLTCQDIMSKDVIVITGTAPVSQAHDLLRARHLRALPVVDAARRLLGVINWPDMDASGPLAQDIMSLADIAHSESLANTLLEPLANGEVHEIMIVDRDMLLVGVVTQTDLIAAFLTGSVLH